MNEPAKLISIMKILLSELERTLSNAPEKVKEGASTKHMRDRIDRLEGALKKREAAEKRRRELAKQNRENNPD